MRMTATTSISPSDVTITLDNYTIDTSSITLPTYTASSIPNTYGIDTVTIDTFKTQNSITLGKVQLTEEKLQKLDALLDIIEGMKNSDLLEMLDTQTALNKVKNGTTESN